MYRDAHNHLQDEWLAPYTQAVETSLSALGDYRCVVNGTHPGDWHAVAELARRRSYVLPSFGVHPWWTGGLPEKWAESLERFLLEFPNAGLGEIGLDRWILESAREEDLPVARSSAAPLSEQVEIFRLQWRLAVQLQRPVTIHCLQAWGALDALLRELPPHPRGFLLHAYGGPVEMVAGWVEKGAYFSYNQTFAHPRKTRQQAAFRAVPEERLLVETDAPAMAPSIIHHPLPLSPEGKPIHHPAEISSAYAALADLRAISPARLDILVENNFRRLFNF